MGVMENNNFSVRKFIRFVFIWGGFGGLFIHFICFELPEQYDLFVNSPRIEDDLNEKKFQDAFFSCSVLLLSSVTHMMCFHPISKYWIMSMA